jgi:hypothetical protein
MAANCDSAAMRDRQDDAPVELRSGAANRAELSLNYSFECIGAVLRFRLRTSAAYHWRICGGGWPELPNSSPVALALTRHRWRR